MPYKEREARLSSQQFGPETWRVEPETGILTLTDDALARVLNPDPFDQWYSIDSEPIASGQFAVVYHCRHRVTGAAFAAKFASRQRLGEDASAAIAHEVAVNVLLNHVNVNVKLEDVFQTATDFVLVMQFAGGGDLQSVLDEEIVPYEETVADFLKQLLRGLRHIHDNNLAHLDIKPQNLVLMGEYPDCEIKLVDFEISRYISPGADVIAFLGTPDYVAPEILCLDPITTKTDMWSVGVLSYVLLCGFLPFDSNSDQQTFIEILRGEISFPNELFEDISEEAIDFIKRLLLRKPEDRMSAQDCLEHPWMNKFYVQRGSIDTLPAVQRRSIDALVQPAFLEPSLDTPVQPIEVHESVDIPAEPTNVPAVETSNTDLCDTEDISTSDLASELESKAVISQQRNVSPMPVIRAESSPSMIGPFTFEDHSSSVCEIEKDAPLPISASGKPPSHPNISSDISLNRTASKPLPGHTPFLNKESRLGSRQNLDRLKTISKSREVLFEKIQMNNVKKSLSKSRDRLHDPKLGIAASRQGLTKCQSLSHSIEALTALKRIHKSDAFSRSCKNLLQPMYRAAKLQEKNPRSMSAIDKIKTDKTSSMQCYQSKSNLNESFNDLLTMRNTNLNATMNDSYNSIMNVSYETKIGGLRANPCRGGRSDAGSDRECCHRRAHPQPTQVIRKPSKVDRMKKDAQRRRKERKEREMREQQKHRKYSLGYYEMSTGKDSIEKPVNASNSPKMRRGSVCHVEQRLQERHEKFLVRLDNLGRLENSEGSQRLSSTESDRGSSCEKQIKSSSKAKSSPNSTDRTKRRRSSKLESLMDGDSSQSSSMESVHGLVDNIKNQRTVTKVTKKDKNIPYTRAKSVETFQQETESMNEVTAKVSPIMDDIVEESGSEMILENGVNMKRQKQEPKIVGVIMKKKLTGFSDIINQPHMFESESFDKSSCEIKTGSDFHRNNEKLENSNLIRTFSSTSDLGSSLSEDSGEPDKNEILNTLNCNCKSPNIHLTNNVASHPNVSRSNSCEDDLESEKKPWGEICNGSIAKAMKNFMQQETGVNVTKKYFENVSNN